MRRWLLAGLLIVSPVFALAATDIQVRHENFADLGNVAILSNPALSPRDLLLVLDAAANPPDPLRELARQGHLIAHIPLAQFLQRAGGNDCLNAVTLLDVFSQHLQQQYRFAHYQRPLLIGIDSAAAFALATLAQAPHGLFEAGIGIRFNAELNLPAPLCPAATLALQPLGPRQHGSQRYRLGAVTPAAHWQVLADPSGLAPALDVLAKPATDTPNLDDLPLVVLPTPEGVVRAPTDTFVILLSGDGGWANIDKDIGETLNRAGLPVVGWNSLQYFWRKKSPEQAGADLAKVIAHYQQTWRRPKVLLIGFSLGADVLPFMIDRLPAAARRNIADTVLLSLSHDVDFEFHVSDWLGSNNTAARPIAPELAKLRGAPLLCIYGKDDDSLCAGRPDGIDVAQLPGDHHFDGDYQSASRLILSHLAKVQKTAPH